MLSGLALYYYFDSLQGKGMSFDELKSSVRNRFVTAEHTRTFLRKWDGISLTSVMAQKS